MKKLILTAVLSLVTFIGFAQKPSPSLLDPTNHSLVLIDYESQMAFAVSNIPIDQLRNNTALVAGASKIFKVIFKTDMNNFQQDINMKDGSSL